MTDKEKLHQILSLLWKNDDSVGKTYYNQALQDVQTAIDLQEEPKKCMYTKDDFTDEDRKALCDGCEEECEHAQNQEPESEDLENAATDICSKVLKGETITIDGYEYVVLSDAKECFKAGAKWQKLKDSTSVSEDWEEAGKEWLRPQLDKSYANYGEVKMMELTHFDGYAMLDAIEFGARWQKEKEYTCYEEAFEDGAKWKKEQIEEILLSEVLPCFMHGGEADEVVAKLDEVLNQKK